MGWLIRALEKGVMRVSNNRNCPYCNPSHRLDVPTTLNACKIHLWANKEWIQGGLESRGDPLENYVYESLD